MVLILLNYPVRSGRQVFCGMRQSMPSSNIVSCEADMLILPSFAAGHTKRPFSNRLLSCHWNAIGPRDNGYARALLRHVHSDQWRDHGSPTR